MQSSTSQNVRVAVMVVVVAMMTTTASAFVTPTKATSAFGISSSSNMKMNMDPTSFATDPSSSLQVAVETLDPTTVLTQGLAGLLNSPVILLVPIGAALGVASLIAWAIVAYANPQVEDDEE